MQCRPIQFSMTSSPIYNNYDSLKILWFTIQNESVLKMICQYKLKIDSRKYVFYNLINTYIQTLCHKFDHKFTFWTFQPIPIELLFSICEQITT